jgi:hypothetical protein
MGEQRKDAQARRLASPAQRGKRPRPRQAQTLGLFCYT